MPNLGSLRESVLDNLQRVAADSVLQQANAERWINQTIRKAFCTRYNWDAMEATYSINTVAGQELYAYPSADTKDVKQIAVRNGPSGNFVPLREDSEDQLDGELPATVTGGVPRGWCRTGSAFRLRPVPSTSEIRIRARVWDYPAPLIGDAATNYWTLQHDDLVEDFATALGFRWLGDLERFGALWQLAQSELKERIEQDSKRLRPSRQTVSPSLRAGKPSSSVGPRIGDDSYYRQYTP